VYKTVYDFIVDAENRDDKGIYTSLSDPFINVIPLSSRFSASTIKS
jgi:hypothetical protein